MLVRLLRQLDYPIRLGRVLISGINLAGGLGSLILANPAKITLSGAKPANDYQFSVFVVASISA